MQLILFRHGPAGDPDPGVWPNDADRPLTLQGIERTRAAALGLAQLIDDVAWVLTSPYARADATARLIGRALVNVPVQTLEALSSGGAPRGVFKALSPFSGETALVLVGHEPDLGVLAGMMIGAGRTLPLKKAGACAIEFMGPPAAGTGQLLWYVPPRILRRLGGKGDDDE